MRTLPIVFFILSFGVLASPPQGPWVLPQTPECDYYDDCPIDYCGDGICNSYENATGTCSSDCPIVVCGDLVCEGNEHVNTCPNDCGVTFNGLKVERVQRCVNGLPWPCNSHLVRQEYQPWETEHVSNDKQRRTFISRVNVPPKNQVKHLIVLFAGQQDQFTDDEDASGVTGQHYAFKTPFEATQSTLGEANVSISPDSLTDRLVLSNPRMVDKRGVFLSLAFDHRHNNEFTISNKNEIERAFFSWLENRFEASNLESVFLAGHSRGGCLALQLSKMFKQNYPEVPLVLVLFDPVCNQEQDEANIVRISNNTYDFPIAPYSLWANRPMVLNPINNDRRAYVINLNQYFPNKQNLRVLNLVSGAQVVTNLVELLGYDVYAFVDSAPGSEVELHTLQLPGFGPTWYTQEWFDRSHMSMGLDVDLMAEAKQFYIDACTEMNCF